MAHNTESSILSRGQPSTVKSTPTRDDTRGSKRKGLPKRKMNGALGNQRAEASSGLQIHSTTAEISNAPETFQRQNNQLALQSTSPTVQGAHPMSNLLSLPVEILAMILWYCHLMDIPRSSLMCVCRSMNKLVEDTPQLWRRILLSLDATPSRLSAGSVVVCGTRKALETCIKRARTLPLETTFFVGRIGDSSPPPGVRRASFDMLISHSHHISHLSIIIDSPFEVIKTAFSGLFTDHTVFPLLESLKIVSGFAWPGLVDLFRPLLNQLECTNVKLRSVYFENVTRDFILVAREYKFWRKLHRVTIKGEYSPIHVTAFEGCEDLEFLSISSELLVHPSSALNPPRRGGPLGILDSDDVDAIEGCESEYLCVHPERKVPLTKVQSLRVGAISMCGLRELQIPKVKFLVIQSALPDEGHQTPVPARSIHLLNLEVFHVAASHSEIIAISAPELHTLYLEISDIKRADADRVVSKIFHGEEGMWKPTTLSINGYIHDKGYEPLYRSLPQIKTLTIIVGEKPSETFYKALEKRGILPNLLHLTIDFDTMPFTTRSGLSIGELPAMSTPPQMHIVHYPPTYDSIPTSSHQVRQGGSALSGSIAGTNLFESDGHGLVGSGRIPIPLSDQVRPLMAKLMKCRRRCPFAFFSCKYRTENLEEIYVEAKICHSCRKNMEDDSGMKPCKPPPCVERSRDQQCGCKSQRPDGGQSTRSRNKNRNFRG